MQWVRRTHMYAGLFLAPWVLMYGLSGFIFNHGDWFGDGSAQPSHWTLDASVATHRLDADTLARQVVAAFNDLSAKEDATSTWLLSRASPPSLQGEILLQGKDQQGGSVLLLLDPADNQGRTFRTPPVVEPQTITVDSGGAELLRAAQDEIVAAATVAQPDLREVHFDNAQVPPLALLLERDGERRVATYDLRSGALTLRVPSGARSMKPSDFLTSLHTSHGYPRRPQAAAVATVRAMFVDAMACLMCFWAVSGVAMWWQMKPYRRSGSAVIVATLIVVGIVWSGMYRLFTSGG